MMIKTFLKMRADLKAVKMRVEELEGAEKAEVGVHKQ